MTTTNDPLWNGPECGMCSGTGIARFIPGDRIPRYATCPACNGHGKEPTEPEDTRRPANSAS